MKNPLIVCDKLMFASLLLMVFFLPFSLALIQIFQAILTVAWILKQFLLKKTAGPKVLSQGFHFTSSGMGWSLIAIALLIFLTIPFSHYPALSLKKFFSRFLQQVFLMYVVTQIVQSRKRLYAVFSVLLLTLSLVIIDCVIQYRWAKDLIHHTAISLSRVSGPMNHPNDLGTLLVTVLPVVLILTITCKNWIPLIFGSDGPLGRLMPGFWKILNSLLLLSLIIALGLTASRGAWAAFALSFVGLGVYLRRFKLVIFTFLLLALFFWIFGLNLLNKRTDIFTTRLISTTVISPSFTNPFGRPSDFNVFKVFFNPSSRDIYWKTASGVINQYPWFGCGYCAYVQTLKDLKISHLEYPHNSLFHITAELGFLGLILYSWFFTALCFQMKKVLSLIVQERDLFILGCGLSAGIFAWFIHSLMDTAWASLQLGLLWWLFIGLILSLVCVSQNYEGEKSCL